MGPLPFHPDPDWGRGRLTQTHVQASVREPEVPVRGVCSLFRMRHFDPEKSSKRVPFPLVWAVVSFLAPGALSPDCLMIAGGFHT